ncbi:DUF3311 domain-containing protein [Listeria aquatica]|uniref:DUF3311 domain-containing protein n=1 Tax=Listeria aquatica FSL S10-1188 TaxID=1265818 RepID=W7B1X1_9LIST|nr:DUF3311 domain-containing protein [Listeria aquatica]EUJ19400.1 hypothetical protein MAQA_07382 [Listeria aquatica FSL S10-1188]
MRKGILLVPFLFILGGAAFANRIEPHILGIPFLLFWIAIGTVLSSLSVLLLYYFEKKKGDDRS